MAAETSTEAPATDPVARDRLRRVSVRGLFGIYEHVIPLNLESGITIIHGPNGVGKTIVLRMINELLSLRPDAIAKIPFEEFELEFQSGDTLLLRGGIDRDPDGPEELVCQALISGERYAVDLSRLSRESEVKWITSQVPPVWSYNGGFWVDSTDGEVISHDLMLSRVRGVDEHRKRSLAGPVMRRVAAKSGVRLIGADRLIEHSQQADPELNRPWRQTHAQGPQRTVEKYSEDLRRRLRDAITNYGAVTERLDRTLIRRLIVESKPGRRFDPSALLRKFRALKEKRQALIDLGLLDDAEEVFQEETDADLQKLIDNSPVVFAIYVEDMSYKLALFDELEKKLQVLRGRTRERFQFKRLVVDPQTGFDFESATGARIPAGDLSSGEQHEMILLYELLFMVEPGSLVLIDEPEISLHLEWQFALLEDLKTVSQLSNVDILMATHSPAIAQSSPELLVRLGRQ